MLYYIILYYIISYYIIFFYIGPSHIIVYHIVLYHIGLYHIILYHIVLYHVVLYHNIPYNTMPFVALCMYVYIYIYIDTCNYLYHIASILNVSCISLRTAAPCCTHNGSAVCMAQYHNEARAQGGTACSERQMRHMQH